jgi:hypothetical protein
MTGTVAALHASSMLACNTTMTEDAASYAVLSAARGGTALQARVTVATGVTGKNPVDAKILAHSIGVAS